jgi:hypothetical protein
VDARYQTAEELGDALRRVKMRLDDDLGEAPPPEPDARSHAWWWVAAAAAAGAGLAWFGLSR